MEFFEKGSYIILFCLCWIIGEMYLDLEGSGKKLNLWGHLLVGWVSFFLVIANIKLILLVFKFLLK